MPSQFLSVVLEEEQDSSSEEEGEEEDEDYQLYTRPNWYLNNLESKSFDNYFIAMTGNTINYNLIL